MCIAGEPGIGKTSLLEMLGERARARGMLVLGGSGAEFERGVPFGAFVDALDDHLATVDRRSLKPVNEDALARLAAVLPSLSPRPEPAGPGIGDERHRTLVAVRTLLEALAASRPVVLAIDDLHWVDDSSLELVSHLIRRRPRAPVLLALAYRPLPLDKRAGPARAAFIAAGADALIEPGPLSRSDAAALVGDRVDRDALEALMAESGGNPFYLEQLTRSGASVTLGAAGSGLDVPAGVAGSLTRELAELSDSERAVCHAAAVAGDPFEPQLVAAGAATSEEVALAAIDALAREGIVQPSDVPRRFRFRHPIVRRAAFESADPGARLMAHARIAELLERSGAPALQRAHHVEAAAAPGDVDAVALLADAGRAAAVRAPAIAARWYAAALRLMPASTEPAERIGLLAAMATAQGSAGMLEQSRQTLLEVLDTLPPELEPMRARILPFLAVVGHMLGRHGEATALLRRALADLGDPRDPRAAELGIETALDCLYEPDYEAMLRYAADADRGAQASGEPPLEVAGAAVCALAHYNVGALEVALAECDRAIALMAPLTDGELAGRLEGVLAVAWTAMCLERHADCILASERGLVISHATGQRHLIVPLTIARTVARTWQGELVGAAADADDLVEAARLSRVDQWIAWALTLRGWIATLAGELELALAYGEESRAIARAQARPSYFVAHSALHLAATQLEVGRAERCIDDVVAAAGGPELPICGQPMRPHYYEMLTRASLILGRLEDAQGWADRAREAAAGSPLGGRRCEAGLAEAAVTLAGGEAEQAGRLALAAARDADSAGDRVLAARARVLAARARAQRSRGAAIGLLEDACAEFEACGAMGGRAEAVRELRRLGRRVGRGGQRGRGLEGASALSGREREVARLVTEGLTNRDVAARLYLSEKTVETHLAAVFRKLNVRGRAAIATALRDDE